VVATISAELVRIDDPLNFTERAAIAGFLAGYTGNTLYLYIRWCVRPAPTQSGPVQPG